MMKKLKGFDIKKLALQHGEKIMLGVAGVLVLFALSGTKWLPYSGHPREITNAVAQGEDVLSHKTWPEDERVKFQVPEEETVGELVSSIRKHVDSSPYQYSQRFQFDLYESTKPLTEPKYLPVQSLIADASRMAMYVTPELSEVYDLVAEEEEPEEDAASTEEDDIPDEFKSAKTGVSIPGQGASLGIPGLDAFLGTGSTTTGQGTSGRKSSKGGRSRGAGGLDLGALASGAGGGNLSMMAAGGFDPSMLSMLGGDAAGMLSGMGLGGSDDMAGLGGFGMAGMIGGGEGRGQRFVAVRGVVPLRDQIKRFQEASNVTFPVAEQLYQIIDFELQRKKMRDDADDPWGADWETVDIEVSKEVLREASQFAAEPHEGKVMDSTITMPLPQRVLGVYGKLATHPDVEQYTLSDDELKLEMEYQQKLMDNYLKNRAEMPEEAVRKKGFSDLVGDTRGMSSAMRFAGGLGMGGAGAGSSMDELSGLLNGGGMGLDPSMMGDFMSSAGLSGMMGMGGGGFDMGNIQQQLTGQRTGFLKEIEDAKDEPERKELLLKYVKEQIDVGGEMLLFRYFDFDVEPGATYQYRVRLEVANPNYGRRSSEAEGLAHVVEGQTRKTEWSNATEPARVRDDVDYFVDTVKVLGDDPTRLKTSMTLFQWDPGYGTTVAKGDLEVELGQELGGHAKTYVLDAAMPRFEIDEDYQFQSGDVLVDATYLEPIDPNQHPDLTLPRKSRRDPGISNQAIVVRSDGKLDVIDQKSRSKLKEDRKTELGYEQRDYADIRGAEAKAAGMTGAGGLLDDLGGLGSMDDLLGGSMFSGDVSSEMMQGLTGKGKGRQGNLLRKLSRGR